MWRMDNQHSKSILGLRFWSSSSSWSDGFGEICPQEIAIRWLLILYERDGLLLMLNSIFSTAQCESLSCEWSSWLLFVDSMYRMVPSNIDSFSHQSCIDVNVRSPRNHTCLGYASTLALSLCKTPSLIDTHNQNRHTCAPSFLQWH